MIFFSKWRIKQTLSGRFDYSARLLTNKLNRRKPKIGDSSSNWRRTISEFRLSDTVVEFEVKKRKIKGLSKAKRQLTSKGVNPSNIYTKEKTVIADN